MIIASIYFTDIVIERDLNYNHLSFSYIICLLGRSRCIFWLLRERCRGILFWYFLLIHSHAKMFSIRYANVLLTSKMMITDILKLWQYSERKFFLELWVATFYTLNIFALWKFFSHFKHLAMYKKTWLCFILFKFIIFSLFLLFKMCF